MESIAIGGVMVFFAAAERAAAERIGRACERTIRLIRECWGLEAPRDLRVCVMTTWLGSTLQCASWPWRIMLGITLPLWGPRARQRWPIAGGWAMRMGGRQVVGVKPPRFLQSADSSIGARIFIPPESMERKMELIACHELTHACTALLRLPPWLNEGLAMVMADRFAGRPTVRPETALVLTRSPIAVHPRRYPRFSKRDTDALVALYVGGYWRTRYFEATQPALLRELLKQRGRCRDWETPIASAYGLNRDEFRRSIDALVAAYFKPGES